METWLTIIVIIVAVYFISWIFNNWRRAKKYDELKPRLDNLDRKEIELKNKQMEWEKKVQSDIEAIDTLAKEKSQVFPWLA